jgi:hypothetical protein
VVFEEETTYAGAAMLTEPSSVQFNHGLGEILTALTAVGLTVTRIFETSHVVSSKAWWSCHESILGRVRF